MIVMFVGMKPNMLGEVSVKWYEAIQTGLPMCVGAAIAGPVRLGPKYVFVLHQSDKSVLIEICIA